MQEDIREEFENIKENQERILELLGESEDDEDSTEDEDDEDLVEGDEEEDETEESEEEPKSPNKFKKQTLGIKKPNK